MDDAAAAPWTAPTWFEPYRSSLVGIEPAELEEHMNRTKHREPLQAIQAVMAESQVKLLERLMRNGLLLAPEPERAARTKAKKKGKR